MTHISHQARRPACLVIAVRARVSRFDRANVTRLVPYHRTEP